MDPTINQQFGNDVLTLAIYGMVAATIVGTLCITIGGTLVAIVVRIMWPPRRANIVLPAPTPASVDVRPDVATDGRRRQH